MNFKYLNLMIFLFLTIFIIATVGQYGVKGGHYQQTLSSRPANETGYCYKKIPYQQARSNGNRAESINNDNVQSNSWTIILDCCDGYERNVTTGRCESNCETNCFGGNCVDGSCTCQSGWNYEDGVCKPICIDGCPDRNSYCFAPPNVCECKFGWEKINDDRCRPVCPGGCVNGRCIAPRVCECNPGFILNEGRQICEPICEGGCPHGECKQPGICSCNPGYVNPPGDREKCEPDCSPLNCGGQSQGQCISPNTCICSPGYTRGEQNNCIPECKNGCPINSRCMSSDRCICNAGFALDYRNNKCIPVDNQHGYSTVQPINTNNHQDNNEPLNQRGDVYHYRDNNQPSNQRGDVYHPINSQPSNQRGQLPVDVYHRDEYYCERPCINGECMGYNICSCKNGYIPDPYDLTRTRCIPFCPGGCPNGVCSGPGFCICKPGYIKDRSGVKGSQRCILRIDY